MKKILIFSLAYYPDFVGGAEVAIKEITDRISKSEASFDMVTAKRNYSQSRFEKIGNVNVYRVGIGNEFFDKFLIPIFGFIKALSLQKNNKYNLTWCMMANQASVTASFFKLFFRKIPLILTIQEGDEEEHLKRYVFNNNFLYKLLIRPWHLMVFKLSDRAIAISDYLKERIDRNKFNGPVEVIPNGVDFEYFSKDFSEEELSSLRKTLAIRKNDKTIITTSRLVEKNAVEDTILSLNYLPKKYKLLILGTGHLLYKLQNLVEKNNLYERVKFLGFVDRVDIPKYLKLSDFFVRPSLSEGQGISFIEAMASGLPVIATPVGGIKDFLVDKKTGLFCKVREPEDIAEKILKLSKDKDLTQSIKNNAISMVEKEYGWDLISQNMLLIFKKTPKIRRKILIVTGDKGGPATYSKILNNRLIEWGFKTKVLSFAEIRHFSKFFGRFIFMTKLKWRALFCDTVYAQDPVSVGFPAILVAKPLRKRFVLKVVGDYAWEQGVQRFNITDSLDKFSVNENYNSKVKFFKRIQKFTANTADTVIVPSNYLKGIISNWGIEENKIKVVHNSFKQSRLSSREELREKLKFGKEKIIISSGRLVPWKGFDGLLDVISKIPEVKLIIADDGPERERLEKKVENLKLRERVAFLGKIDHTSLLEYIKASDLFVLNSSYEGFSHLLLETMSVGTPIVTTRIGGNPELITNGEDGLLVESGNNEELFNAMKKVLGDSELASKFSQNGLERIKNFNEDIMLEKLTKIL